MTHAHDECLLDRWSSHGPKQEANKSMSAGILAVGSSRAPARI